MTSSIGPGPRPLRGALRVAVACAPLALVVGTAGAATLAVRHDAPACILADTFPRLEATLDPAAAGARVRVAFRPEAGTLWHAVAAEVADGTGRAVLPRPRLSAQRIHYRFESVGADASIAASEEYAAPVVADAAACRGAAAETVAAATVLVEVPPGAPLVPPVPAGFDPIGAVSATPHRASSRKRFGILAGVIVGGGAVAGGVIAAGSEPPPTTLLLQPGWSIRSSTPPLFGQVSISANSMVAEISVVSPRTLQPGNAWVIFFNPTNPVLGHPCAVLTGNHPLLEAGREARFNVTTPFVVASPCGASNTAHIVFRQGSGATTVYESGTNELPDASVSYTFVP